MHRVGLMYRFLMEQKNRLLIRMSDKAVDDLEYLVRTGSPLASRAEIIRQLIIAEADRRRYIERHRDALLASYAAVRPEARQ